MNINNKMIALLSEFCPRIDSGRVLVTIVTCTDVVTPPKLLQNGLSYHGLCFISFINVTLLDATKNRFKHRGSREISQTYVRMSFSYNDVGYKLKETSPVFVSCHHNCILNIS